MKQLLLILFLSLATPVLAVIDPPGCDVGSGGQGNTSVGGMNFLLANAHVGDTVSVSPSLGMVVGACRTINATGTVYISTGALTNFMENVTLNPDGIHICPADGLCTPGPYSFVITSGMVGAGVTSPNQTVSGTSKRVKAISNGFGTVNAGIINEQLADSHSGSITIVTPCIQVFKTCGVSCVGSNLINFTGYVTNCGDINLTNVTLVDDRTNTLYNLDDSPLSQPFNLNTTAVVQFKGTFAPNGSETSTATNTITATGTDTTTIGGPNASVTNTVTAICSITSCIPPCQCPVLILKDTLRFRRYASLNP